MGQFIHYIRKYLVGAGILGNHQNHGDKQSSMVNSPISPTPVTVDPTSPYTETASTTTTSPTINQPTSSSSSNPAISTHSYPTKNNEKTKHFHSKTMSDILTAADIAEGGGDQEIYVDDSSQFGTAQGVTKSLMSRRSVRSVGARGASAPVLIENQLRSAVNKSSIGRLNEATQRNISTNGKRLTSAADVDDDVEQFDDSRIVGQQLSASAVSSSNEDELMGDEPKVMALRPIIRGPVAGGSADDTDRPAIVYAEPHAEIKLSCDVDLDIMSTVWMKDGRVRRDCFPAGANV